jgi:predicted transcriptional regulator of viral defense system
MTASQDRQRLLGFASTRGIFRANEAEAAGIHSQWLYRLAAEGELERVVRGCYRLAGQDTTEHHTLAIAAAIAPSAVVCLLSAL